MMKDQNNPDNNLQPLVKTNTMAQVHRGTTFMIVRYAIIFFSSYQILKGFLHWIFWGHL